MSAQPIVYAVDDEEHILSCVRRTLERNGFKVECFTAPAAILSKLAQGDRPALIIPDRRMPGMHGEQLAAEARAVGYAGPILMLSGTPPDTVPAGIDRVMEKPFVNDDLRAAAVELVTF